MYLYWGETQVVSHVVGIFTYICIRYAYCIIVRLYIIYIIIYTLIYCNYIFILPFHGQCWEAQTRLFSKRHHKVMFKFFTPPEKKIKRCQFDVFALAFTGILQNVEKKVDPA